jgi:two-component sensor histidine kinase
MPPEMQDRFESRLIALSRTHDHLTSTGWQSANLQSIVQEILAPSRAGREDRIEASGAPVKLTPRQALALAMVLNELATNALRHGSLSEAGGTLKISWMVRHPTVRPRLYIRWTERGHRGALPPDRKGFGMRLIERSIERELNGELTLKYARTGLRSLLSIPLA